MQQIHTIHTQKAIKLGKQNESNNIKLIFMTFGMHFCWYSIRVVAPRFSSKMWYLDVFITLYTWNKLSNRFKLIFRVQLYKIVFISHTIILDNTNILIVSSKTVAMLLCEPMRISLNLCFLSQFLSHLCFPLSLHRFRFLRSVVSKIGNKKSLQLELNQKGRIHIWLFYFQNSMHERPLCFSNKQIEWELSMNKMYLNDFFKKESDRCYLNPFVWIRQQYFSCTYLKVIKQEQSGNQKKKKVQGKIAV